MLGPMGAYVISALRLLTPSEIDRYTKPSSKKKARVSAMAAGAEEYAVEEYAVEEFASDGAAGKPPDTAAGSRAKSSDAEIIPIKGRGSPFHNKEEQAEQALDGPSPGSDPPTRAEFIPMQPARVSVNAENQGQPENDSIQKSQGKEAPGDLAAVFLLEERQKLKESNTKIAEGNALKSYNDIVNADFSQADSEDDYPEGERPQGLKGILINKKHY